MIFAIAFCDAVILLGAIVPALPLMFAVGVLIGLGQLSGPYALVCAALGAFAGDAISFWVGRRWGPQLRGHWPFRKYPQLLDRGEIMFRRNAMKSLFIARYVGAVRPFVPAIAGMMHMPLRRYVFISLLASASWAPVSYTHLATFSGMRSCCVWGILCAKRFAAGTGCSVLGARNLW